MKQIDQCMARAVLLGKEPLPSKKWKAFVVEHPEAGRILYLYHYHHEVLIYAIDKQLVVTQWWELPTDKRGLEAAKRWLEEYHKKSAKTS